MLLESTPDLAKEHHQIYNVTRHGSTEHKHNDKWIKKGNSNYLVLSTRRVKALNKYSVA